MKEERKLTNDLTPQSIFYEYLYNSATNMFNLYSLVTLESMYSTSCGATSPLIRSSKSLNGAREVFDDVKSRQNFIENIQYDSSMMCDRFMALYDMQES